MPIGVEMVTKRSLGHDRAADRPKTPVQSIADLAAKAVTWSDEADVRPNDREVVCDE
jgi:hypothetical protein